MGVLDYNFGFRHAKRSIKGSIDADDRLVSKNSLSQNMAHGPIKVGLKFKNMSSLWRRQEKTPHSNQKFF